MEKHVKIKSIAKITRFIQGFYPVTQTTYYPMYMILTNRLSGFKRWPETERISREEFEKELHNDPELVDAYLELFSKKAEFYLCKINYDDLEYHYCIMCMGKQIVMLYYRKILLIVDK